MIRIRKLYISFRKQIDGMTKFIWNILDTVYFVLKCKNNYIAVNCWVSQRFGHVIPNNFGDDINIPLIEFLTGKKVRVYNNIINKPSINYLCIGSVIDYFGDSQSIIWGSGFLCEDSILKYKPVKVYAVRGPLSRDLLLKQGIPCPEVYGDPALLFPLIYNPKIEKKYKLGIIPHYVDFDLPQVKEFRDQHKEILFIKLKGYSSWQEVIDQIMSCENIASSSLHGLIISDAYNIPNIRIQLSNKVRGGDFKYKDYYSGVNKAYSESIDSTTSIDIKYIYDKLSNYSKIEYDYKALLQAFPLLASIFSQKNNNE